MIKVVSLDLQGTLSDSKFSNYFWINLLPQKYSEKYGYTLETSKKILKEEFKIIGKYNILYYDDKYWSKRLGFNTLNELDKFEIRPRINSKLDDFIQAIKLPKIIISTTTNDFIKYELKEKITDFYKVYSCVDYFDVGGKTRSVFLKVCKELSILPEEMLHIGDSRIMDYENARKAGVNAILFDGNVDRLREEIKNYLEV